MSLRQETDIGYWPGEMMPLVKLNRLEEDPQDQLLEDESDEKFCLNVIRDNPYRHAYPIRRGDLASCEPK